jgi:hypothetical protein
MTRTERWIRLSVLGWALVAAFGVLVGLFVDDHAAFGLVNVVVAVGLATWVWLRRSRLALGVSFAIGLLVLVEQLGYVVAGVSSGEYGMVFAQDLLGLAGGLCVVFGSGAAWRQVGRAAAASPATADVS